MTTILTRSAWRRCALLSVVMLLGACASAPPPPPVVATGDEAAVIRHVQARLAHATAAGRIAGLSLALVDDQRVVWAGGAGWADADTRRAADAHTVYRMGSISKLLTDVAALQLVGEGRLALDAPIEQALPDFRLHTRLGDAPITPRQLMTHHAGLPRDLPAGMWGTTVTALRSVLPALAGQDADYPPGLLFSYSNVGITVLGAAVERLDGVPFAQTMRQRLLDPLGMASAAFDTAPPTGAHAARAHRAGQLADEPALRDVPAGGLNASVLDMAQFLKMVFARGQAQAGGNAGERGATVLDPALLASMLQRQNGAVPLDVGFQVGLGWMLSTVGTDTIRGAGPVAHHSGATFHFRSQMIALPAHRLGVIVAANDSTAGPLVNQIATEALALLLQARTGIAQPPAEQREPGHRPAREPWTTAALQAVTGDYATVAGLVQVRRHGERLQAELAGQTLALLPGEDGRLGLRYALLGWVPLRTGLLDQIGIALRRIDGRDVLVAYLDGESLLVGERLPAPGPADALPLPPGRFVPRLAPGEAAVVSSATLARSDGRAVLALQLDLPGAASRLARPLQRVDDVTARLVGPLADRGPTVRLLPSGEIDAGGYRWRRVPD
jgi:CubicO group peptidase (beta-lactamase class C family)